MLPLLAATLLALSACSGSTTPSADATVTASSGVTVTGKFGKKPDLTVPATAAPTTLRTDVLSKGDGATVGKGDLIVVDYLGQTWKPKANKENVFDNSFDRKQPAAFPIGVGQVVKGWDEALVGKRVGSRVLLTLPPDKAYGGKASGSIPANSTLVFVVDLVNAFDKGSTASGAPVKELPPGLPTVSDGGAGKAPSVTIGSAKAPKKPTATVLIKGDGASLDGAKNIAVQVQEVSWPKGATVSSTYGSSPAALPLQQLTSQLPALGAALKGQQTGTRVLLTLPAQGTTRPAEAAVVDIVGVF